MKTTYIRPVIQSVAFQSMGIMEVSSPGTTVTSNIFTPDGLGIASEGM